MRGRCAQSSLCGAFGEGVSVVGWWCFGEVSRVVVRSCCVGVGGVLGKCVVC